MQTLLVKPTAVNATGRIIHVTPESAGWRYVGFDVYRLSAGTPLKQATEGNEALLVVLSGRARVTAAGVDFGVVGARMSPFDGTPWSVYVPAKAAFEMTPETPVELAICRAPAEGRLPPRVIPAGAVKQTTRGRGTNTRFVRSILLESEPAESLLVSETITPSGHWSSYPPHKHDTDNRPAESYLEETYYHRLSPSQGYALQRVYTDDRTLDVTVAPYDGDVVLVPRGYHPVAAPYGFDLYYLNVMAGPHREWHVHNEPSYEWLLQEC
jgi:5-deoxy-glucuronate isomerase